MSDYLERYVDGNEFRISELINDDHFGPVRLMFQNRHFVSASKLLLIAIDTFGFIEFGDTKSPAFVRWLDEFADLSAIGVSSTELWEHRNALLHFSGLASRRVSRGQVRMLVSYVGQWPSGLTLGDTTKGYYDLQKLILAVGHAANRWIDTYGQDPGKYASFIERYDKIASDARMLHIGW